jgi:hypothetical protein
MMSSREEVAHAINVGMWGRELANIYRCGGDVRWTAALRAADVLIADIPELIKPRPMVLGDIIPPSDPGRFAA